MDFTYRPYNDPPEIEVLMERIHPPRVCVDNAAHPDCTLVKVDSTNKPGMLLEMVQVLTDLDLLISKSYISSDGGWVMDVFHVTDQWGHKVTDESFIHYIEDGICAIRKASKEEPTSSRPRHVLTGHMAIEMTGIDRPGMMSEITAVLAELRCHVSAAVAWTHNRRVACIIYIDGVSSSSMDDPYRAAEVQAHLENVAEAHHYGDERWSVRLISGRTTHAERRLHQLMAADCDDYNKDQCCCCCGEGGDDIDTMAMIGGDYYPKCHNHNNGCCCCDGTPHVRIGYCREKEYSVITVRSRDRPKLLFDTVCTMTDLDYVVYHASIRSNGSTAYQEYYVKQKGGHPIDAEEEKRKVIRCLIAAIERRASHGLRLDICTHDRDGLLSEITRVFRENGLSISRVEIGTRDDKAVGTFYVNDTSGQKVTVEMLEKVRQEIGGINITVEKDEFLRTTFMRTFTSNSNSSSSSGRGGGGIEGERPRFSLGTLLWSHIERLSGNFRPIKW